MICTFCGSEIKDTDKFCMSCGTAVSMMAPSQVAPAAEPVAQVTEPAPAVEPAAPQGAFFADAEVNAPAQPVYAQPEQPMYGQQNQPVFAQPEQPTYSQSVYGQNTYSQPAYGQNIYGESVYGQPVGPAMTPEDQSSATSTLVLGIIGLCCAVMPYVTFVGIILGGIGLSKSNALAERYGALKGKALAGRILSRIGLIFGIIDTAIYLVVIILVCSVVIATGSL